MSEIKKVPETEDSKEDGIENPNGWITFPIAIVLILIGIGIATCNACNSGKSSKNDKDSDTNQPQASGPQNFTVNTTPFAEYTSYSINADQWIHIDVPYGIKELHYINVAVPYSVHNRNGIVRSSTGTEDISGLFNNDHSTDNLELWIKAQNGSGTIDLQKIHY